MLSHELKIQTHGRGFIELTPNLQSWLAQQRVESGLLNLFIRHTSASLICCENADPDVLRDLEVWMSELVSDGDRRFRHRLEGDDDMAAHVRSVLTASSLSVPVRDKRLVLGTWQGLFLWEHRYQSHARTVFLSLLQ